MEENAQMIFEELFNNFVAVANQRMNEPEEYSCFSAGECLYLLKNNSVFHFHTNKEIKTVLCIRNNNYNSNYNSIWEFSNKIELTPKLYYLMKMAGMDVFAKRKEIRYNE